MTGSQLLHGQAGIPLDLKSLLFPTRLSGAKGREAMGLLYKNSGPDEKGAQREDLTLPVIGIRETHTGMGDSQEHG